MKKFGVQSPCIKSDLTGRDSIVDEEKTRKVVEWIAFGEEKVKFV